MNKRIYLLLLILIIAFFTIFPKLIDGSSQLPRCTDQEKLISTSRWFICIKDPMFIKIQMAESNRPEN
jgi:hypothetical protein